MSAHRCGRGRPSSLSSAHPDKAAALLASSRCMERGHWRRLTVHRILVMLSTMSSATRAQRSAFVAVCTARGGRYGRIWETSSTTWALPSALATPRAHWTVCLPILCLGGITPSDMVRRYASRGAAGRSSTAVRSSMRIRRPSSVFTSSRAMFKRLASLHSY
eukprot:12772863-Prorocentrum_lima.AAC.1